MDIIKPYPVDDHGCIVVKPLDKEAYLRADAYVRQLCGDTRTSEVAWWKFHIYNFAQYEKDRIKEDD